MALVEEKYPNGDNDEYRRLALEQVIQWFPEDPNTVFEATLNIYRLGWTSENSAKSVKKIRSLLKKFGSQVTVNNRVWAEFLLARGMWSANKSKQAPAMLLRLAENEELTAFRRGWSAYEAAVMIMESDEKKALKVLNQNMNYMSDARSAIDGLYGRLLLRRGDFKGLVEFFESLASERGDGADASYQAITRRVIDYWSEYSTKSQNQVREFLNTFYAENLRFEEALDSWTAFNQHLESVGARADLELALREYLEKANPEWFSEIKEDSAALIERIISANDSSDIESLLNASMNLLLAGECGYEEFVEYGRWAMWWMNRREVEVELLDTLGKLSLNLQGDSEAELFIGWQMLGERYRESGNADLSREYFKAVISSPDAKRYQRVAAAAGLAQLELQQKRTEAALAAFELVEKDYSAHADASDFLLMDGFFRLELGQYEKALEVFRMALTIEQKYLDQADYSVATSHVLKDLERGEALIEFWKHSENWWPKWEELCVAYGVEVGSVVDLYSIDDFEAINSEMSQASKDGDVDRYFAQLRVFAVLAKWIPIFGVDYSNKVSFAEEIDEALAEGFTKVVIEAIGSSPVVNRETSASLDVKTSVLLINSGRSVEAIPVAKRLLRNSGTSSSLGQSGLRLWLHAANMINEGYEEPTMILKDLLSSDVNIEDRVSSVRTLSDLYYNTRNYPETVALFESESKNEQIVENEELVGILEARVNLLQAEASRMNAFTDAVNKWINNRDLEWFNEIPPYELDASDPKFSTAPISMPSAPEGQEFKANVLFALDEDNAIDEREEAFLIAAVDSMFLSKTAEEVYSKALEIIESFPMEVESKARIVITSLIIFGSELNVEYARKILDTDFSKTLKEDVMDSWRMFFDSLALFNESPEKLGESMAIAVEIPISYNVDLQIRKTLQRMVYLGQSDLADEWFEKTKSMKLGDYVDKTLPGYRLGWMRAIKEAKSTFDFDRSLRELVLQRMDVSEISRPEAMDTCIDWSHFHRFSESESKEIIAYMLDSGIFPNSGLSGISYSISGRLFSSKGESDFGLDLLELIENSDLPDHIARVWIGFAMGRVDVDTDAYDRSLSAKVAAFLESESLSEETKQVVEIVSRRRTIRTSDEEEPDSFFSEKAAEVFEPMALFSTKLRYHYSRGQWAALGALLEANDYTALEDLTSLAIAYQGLVKSGREDEAFLMKDVTAGKIEEQIATSWVEAPTWEFGDLLTGCIVLEDSESVTKDLSNAVLSRVGENFHRKLINMELAYLYQDWEDLEKRSLEVLDSVSDFYDANGYLGMVFARNNKVEDAKKHLDLFLKHSRDSIIYQKAKSLRDSL